MSFIFNELLLILTDFGAGGSDPQDDVVRFLLPSIFWIILSFIALRQWRTGLEKRDLYVGIAAFIGFSREIFMFVMQYGSWRGFIPHDVVFRLYPPIEHSLTLLASLLLGYSFMKYFLPWQRFSYYFFITSVAVISLLYLTTAPLWISYLATHPDALFGAFWGDMAFRTTGSILMCIVIVSLVINKKRNVYIPMGLIIAFSFLFLDDFLMIFNLANGEKYRTVYAPIRHNLHIWAIPLFLTVYWTDQYKRLIIMENQLIQSKKMEAIGMLSAGVAHEINNPINSIINYGQILADELTDNPMEKDIAGRIMKEGDRIAAIVRSLLSYGREQRDEKKNIQLSNVFAEMLALTDAQIRKDGIHLVTDIAENLPQVVANPQQLQQVFLNVINNARYALNRKYPDLHSDKIFEIKLECVTVEDIPYVRISFLDHGIGIPSDILDKTVQPFFSTKPSGQGTGLGLSISQGIIKEHGGKLSLESKEGKYTRVIIDLPVKM